MGFLACARTDFAIRKYVRDGGRKVSRYPQRRLFPVQGFPVLHDFWRSLRSGDLSAIDLREKWRYGRLLRIQSRLAGGYSSLDLALYTYRLSRDSICWLTSRSSMLRPCRASTGQAYARRLAKRYSSGDQIEEVSDSRKAIIRNDIETNPLRHGLLFYSLFSPYGNTRALRRRNSYLDSLSPVYRDWLPRHLSASLLARFLRL